MAIIVFITKTITTIEKVSTLVLWTQGTPSPKRCALFLDFLPWKECLQCILQQGPVTVKARGADDEAEAHVCDSGNA